MTKSLELLQCLANAALPAKITDRALIDKLRVLDAAEYVNAFIPPVHFDCDDCARQDPASVLAITPRGRAALAAEVDRLRAPPRMPGIAARKAADETVRKARTSMAHGVRLAWQRACRTTMSRV